MLENKLSDQGSIATSVEKRKAIMIMVAEKDPMTAELEEYFLNNEGYNVHVVLDGRKAVKEAETEQPDLIIMDILLSGLNGLKVCVHLKRNRKTQHIPILVFSILDVRDRAIEAGADAFLLKPIQQLKLLDAVKTMLVKEK